MTTNRLYAFHPKFFLARVGKVSSIILQHVVKEIRFVSKRRCYLKGANVHEFERSNFLLTLTEALSSTVFLQFISVETSTN